MKSKFTTCNNSRDRNCCKTCKFTR